MVKALQVLRVHLVELEKVNELCRDFCGRYCLCLKHKFRTELLAHSEAGPEFSGLLALADPRLSISSDSKPLSAQCTPTPSPTHTHTRSLFIHSSDNVF